ncbi:hypothetical protein BX600DRAFT_444671, partial [Xylariales sp. PMI_506]
MSSARVCIGHEGFVRLCDHEVIKLDEIASMASSLSRLHIGRLATVHLRSCNHPSHGPRHRDGANLLAVGERTIPRDTVQGHSNGDVTLALEWAGHLNLPELDDVDLLTPELIHKKLKQDIRPGAAEHIVPELPPGRLPEMICFDPNRCSCLHYPGSEQLGRGWLLTPIQNIRFATCRADPMHELGLEPHRTCLATTGITSNGTSWVNPSFKPCTVDPQCLEVAYKRVISVLPRGHAPGSTNIGWCQALDPDSYNLTEDKDGLGVFWCHQEGCLNYYRYIRRPFAKYHPCLHRQC